MKKVILLAFVSSSALGFNVHASYPEKNTDMCVEELDEAFDIVDDLDAENLCRKWPPAPGKSYCTCGKCPSGEICKHYKITNGAACRCVPAPVTNPCPHGCGPGQPQPPP